MEQPKELSFDEAAEKFNQILEYILKEEYLKLPGVKEYFNFQKEMIQKIMDDLNKKVEEINELSSKEKEDLKICALAKVFLERNNKVYAEMKNFMEKFQAENPSLDEKSAPGYFEKIKKLNESLINSALIGPAFQLLNTYLK